LNQSSGDISDDGIWLNDLVKKPQGFFATLKPLQKSTTMI